jgi:phosphatidylglycerophosphatase A
MVCKRWLATCCGLGWLPPAPGTWGSLPPAVAFGLLMYFRVPGVATMVVLGVMALGAAAACVLFAPASMAATGKNDPSEVVSDEFAAQALTFLVVPLLVPRPLTGWESFLLAGVGFLAFRVIDITKPWPIKKLERFPAGWGILADDIAAAIGAAVIVYVALRLLVSP